jgi:putative membrane protein
MIQRILGTSTQMLAQASEVVSQITSEETTASLIRHLTAVVVFSMVGVLVLALCFFLISRFVPFSVAKEIEEDQNVALAIIVASVILGMSIIIAASILG